MHEGTKLRALGMLLLVGLLTVAGCRGCQQAPPPADAGAEAVDAGGAAVAPEPVPVNPTPGEAMAAPQGELDTFGKRYENPADGPQPFVPGKPMSLVPLPTVSDEEIDNEPALAANPNLPLGSKRTLKVLQKLTQTDPRFDPKKNPGNPNAEPPADNVKKGPSKAP
jgi:hypothetical protein